MNQQLIIQFVRFVNRGSSRGPSTHRTQTASNCASFQTNHLFIAHQANESTIDK